MRLTDRCVITKDGSPYLSPEWRCELRHAGGDLSVRELYERPAGVTYAEAAVLMVGASAELAALQTPEGLAVTHKGKGYIVDAILPRYRPGGRLHHVSLTLSTDAPA